MSESWTFEEQAALDAALYKNPSSNFSTQRERWEKVASQVPGRSIKECVLRYRYA